MRPCRRIYIDGHAGKERYMIRRNWIEEIRSASPRVHCITNYVTAGDVANLILAAGGSPIMAHGIKEVEDVTSICQSLVLNMGTLDEDRVNAMILAGKKSASMGHPIILDPVGVTASRFRRIQALRILSLTPPSLIRGNAAEIHALDQALKGMDKGNVCGVDSRTDIDREMQIQAAISLGKRSGAVVVMTGEEDIVAGPGRILTVGNGHPWMAKITGGGCMLDGVLGVFCAAAAVGGLKAAAGLPGEAVSAALLEEAASAALCAHGICGELAAGKAVETGGQTGSFRMYLMDYMSILDDDMLTSMSVLREGTPERGEQVEIS